MLDTCICRSNLGFFALFLLSISLTLWHAALLFLSCVCDNALALGGTILVPTDCSVFNDKFQGDADLESLIHCTTLPGY